MNLPNTLSLIRILLAPVFGYLFLSDNKTLVALSLPVFTIAALTDWYDGWYARKYGFKTRWGQFLDPLADKILTSSALICFYILEQRVGGLFGYSKPVPILILVLIIIARDMILTVARSISEIKGKEFKTSYISKTKTFVQMTYIFIFIVCVFFTAVAEGTSFDKISSAFLFSSLNYYILAIITLLTAGTGIAYIFESKG